MDCTFSLKQTALLYACRVIGGRKLLARKIGATASQIGNWINRGDKIPYHYALLIVKEARGVVSLDQLCPDMHHVNKLVTQSDQPNTHVPINVIHYNEKKFLLHKQICKRRENLNPVTLTQPILVDTDYQLLAFLDRFQAHQQAKSNLVPVIVVDVEHHLRTETQMDIITHLCVPSECVIVAEIIKERLGQRQGRPTKDKRKKKGVSGFKGRSLDLVARLVGFGNRVTYSHAKYVLAHGHNELIQAMDKKQFAISMASKISRLPLLQQYRLLQQDKKAIRLSLREMSKSKKEQQLDLRRGRESVEHSDVFSSESYLIDIIELYSWLQYHDVPVTLIQRNGQYILQWNKKA